MCDCPLKYEMLSMLVPWLSYLQERRRLLKRGGFCSFPNCCPISNYYYYRKSIYFRILKIMELKWETDRDTLGTFSMHKWVPENIESTSRCPDDPISCPGSVSMHVPISYVGWTLRIKILVYPQRGNSILNTLRS